MGAIILTNCLILLTFSWFLQFADIQVSAIINGTKVNIAEAPFMAIFATVNNGYISECGAVIINAKMLLSAEHCNHGVGNQTVIVGTDFYNRSLTPIQGQYYGVKQVIDHPGTDANDDDTADLCVIILKIKLKFSDQVKPIVMADINVTPKRGELLTIYGFGITETGKRSHDLLKLQTPFVAQTDCDKMVKPVLPNSIICTGGVLGKGVCTGDSGGPVVFMDRLIGILSAASLPCAQDTLPDVIVYVPVFRDFIVQNLDTQCAFRPLGGSPIQITDAPFVAFFKLGDKTSTCVATIVHKKFLVATAHCLQEVAFLNRELTITVGSSEPEKNDGRKYVVEKVFIHPKFDDDSYDFDLSVIKLKETLTLSDHVKTAELADSMIKSIPGTSVTVYGFRRLKTESLHRLTLPYYDWRDCHYLYSLNANYLITHRMFCAGEERKEDACAGDAGGPAIYNNLLFGITSWGQDSCTRRYPSVFTYLPPLKSYIEEIIKSNTERG